MGSTQLHIENTIRHSEILVKGPNWKKTQKGNMEMVGLAKTARCGQLGARLRKRSRQSKIGVNVVKSVPNWETRSTVIGVMESAAESG